MRTDRVGGSPSRELSILGVLSAGTVGGMRILVTGAAGNIGTVVSAGLAEQGHLVRGLDLREPADASTFTLGWITGSALDPETVDRAVDGVDAVVHLAGNPGEASLPDSLESHVHTTARLLDAMVRHGVSRMAYASSNHAVGMTERTDSLPVDVRGRPDTFYGVAKVAAEGLLSLYADRHGINSVAMRIGSFLPEPASTRALATWLSPADTVRMVLAAVTTDRPGYHVLYGISANSDGWWDLQPGHELGYSPQDDAAAFAGAVPDRPGDAAEGERVGGPFALPDAGRPAFD